MYEHLLLESDQLSVTLLPDKGCDVYALVDRRTGVDVLFKSPWGLRTPPWYGTTSMERWIEAYPGGWQVLLPNGGDECTYEGAHFGYHGEAAMVRWWVEEHGASHLTTSVALTTAPLSMRREVVVDGPVLRVTETVTNHSPDPFACMWSHHPAFGAPFIDGSCHLAVGCSTVIADDRAPGTLLEPGSRHEWPIVTARDGRRIDLRRIPPPSEPRALLGYCSDFVEPYFALRNPELRLGVGIRWDAAVFPKAWLWQEVHSGQGWPWYKRAYVVAVEPASTIPGQGFENARAKGETGVEFAPNESRQVTVEAVVFHDDREVEGIDPGGVLRFA
jgi:hypothetical protein